MYYVKEKEEVGARQPLGVPGRQACCKAAIGKVFGVYRSSGGDHRDGGHGGDGDDGGDDGNDDDGSDDDDNDDDDKDDDDGGNDDDDINNSGYCTLAISEQIRVIIERDTVIARVFRFHPEDRSVTVKCL